MRATGKRGFTIIELITVIAMILILMGAITSSVFGARRRTKIQQAITEAQELTQAIQAYENYIDEDGNSPLKPRESWTDASESDMAFVLGKVSNPNGEGDMPVLYQGAVTRGFIRDPWGRPYQYRIIPSDEGADDDYDDGQGKAAFAIPNINRIPADEVN